MKTHRQALIEKLDNEFGRTVNATPATIEHLLLLCNMLDERTDQFRGVTKKIETPVEHAEIVRVLEREFRDGKSWELEQHAFPDELVERCRNAQQTAIRDALSKRGECHPDVGLLAVLAELAKADITELPKGVILPVGDATGAAHAVLNMVRPILAAKGAEILRQQSVIRVQNRIAEDYVSRGVHEAHVADLKTRIAELEGHRTTLTNLAAQYQGERDHVEETCRMHSERVIALEKELSTTNDIYTDEREERGMYQARCAELEKRIDELTALMVVNGETPGQVLKKAYADVAASELDGAEQDEQVASIVLRAFGNRAGALKQARIRIEKCGFIGVGAGVLHKQCQDFVDAEIAKLGETPQIISKEDARRIVDNGLTGLGTPFDDVPKNKQCANVLRTLRERFTHTPEPGDGDDGKWVRRSDVLNAIDEIAKLA